MPHYDAGLNIIYTVAKGESTIRYYEIHNNHILYLNEHRELTSGKSFCYLPKYCINTHKNELLKILKINEASLESISLI